MSDPLNATVTGPRPQPRVALASGFAVATLLITYLTYLAVASISYAAALRLGGAAAFRAALYVPLVAVALVPAFLLSGYWKASTARRRLVIAAVWACWIVAGQAAIATLLQGVYMMFAVNSPGLGLDFVAITALASWAFAASALAAILAAAVWLSRESGSA